MPSSCCCVPGCANRGGHRFPKDDTLKKLWVIAIKRDQKRGKLWEPTPFSVVCREHFNTSDYIQITTYGIIASYCFNVCFFVLHFNIDSITSGFSISSRPILSTWLIASLNFLETRHIIASL